MATPMSARASTGASCIPSPTNAVRPFPLRVLMMLSNWVSLSAGNRSPWYSSRPRVFETLAAISPLAGQHDEPFHAALPQAANDLCRLILQQIPDDQVPRVSPANSDMHH